VTERFLLTLGNPRLMSVKNASVTSKFPWEESKSLFWVQQGEKVKVGQRLATIYSQELQSLPKGTALKQAKSRSVFLNCTKQLARSAAIGNYRDKNSQYWKFWMPKNLVLMVLLNSVVVVTQRNITVVDYIKYRKLHFSYCDGGVDKIWIMSCLWVRICLG